MKVLLINSVCKNGSTGKITYDLFSQLRANGHEAAICYGRGQRIDEDGICKTGYDWETKLHALLSRLTGFTGCFSYFSTKKLLHFIDSYKPDVVHIHELHGYYANIFSVVAFLKKKRIPTVWTFHCEYMYTGKCGYAYDCDKWKTNCGKCPLLSDYPASWFFDFTKVMRNKKKRAYVGFDNLAIITPSRWLADRVKESFLNGKNIRVVHNGINTYSVFYPREVAYSRKKCNISEHEKVVLAVAPDIMSERKGGAYVVELAKRMEAQPIRFILIGVKDTAGPFPHNVLALGRTEDQSELAEYYSMADVFVICSKKETFSLTCAEALCCGTPVAGFEAGAPESIFRKPYANFVPYGNVDALAQKIKQILSCATTRNDTAQYGKNEFSNDTMYKNYLREYQDMRKEAEK